MIVIGFFQQIFDRITIESVRDALVVRSLDKFVTTSRFWWHVKRR